MALDYAQPGDVVNARPLGTKIAKARTKTLVKTDDRPEQKAMKNSTQQAHNVDGSLSVWQGSMADGPVLLVDDMVDSRWTFTVAAWLLQEHGSGPVYPLALALAGHDE